MRSLAEHLIALERKHGSMRKAAAAVGIDCGYWSRLRSGEKTEPSAEVLDKLGLVKVVVYKLKGAL